MSLRFFADQCAPNYVIEALRRQGHEVFRLRDHLPVDSPDPAVLAKAQDLGCILLSLNGDFADIVAYPPSTHQGVFALQVQNHPQILPEMMALVVAYLAEKQDMAQHRGKLLLVEPHRIRIRQ